MMEGNSSKPLQTFALTVEAGGLCEFKSEPSNSRHQHPYWEICLVLRGSGEYEEDGRTYPVSRGDLFASPPDTNHEIRSLQTRDLELFFVSLTARGAPGGLGSEDEAVIESFIRSHRVVVGQAEALNPYVDLIGRAQSQTIRDGLARLFALEAMELLANAPRRSPKAAIPSPDIQRALRFIDDNCSSALTVEDVANHVGLAPRSLLRRFQTQLGHGVSKEIRRRRMRRAAHRLLMGYPVHEVGQSLGIDDASQFSAAFLAEIGVRPKVFQQTYIPGVVLGSAKNQSAK